MEGKTQADKRPAIRSAYFYLASLVTLGIVVGSVIFLINLGFKAWVFTDAEPAGYERGAPASLYASSKINPEDAVSDAFLECDGPCELTAAQESDIETWKANYTSWKEAYTTPNAGRTRDAVNGFSFLIVALPFFLIHYRIVQRDERKNENKEHAVIRPTYYYFISLSALLMIVIAGGFLINLGLKTWVFPSAGEADKASSRYEMPAAELAYEKAPIESIVECGEECGVDADTVTLAQGWLTDYENWNNSVHDVDSTQREAAAAIPFILVGAPLFWYHWSTVRRESKRKKESSEAPVQ
ncbi:MAG: DUF5671 domain-containing protein [Patescibacteria group bacterium]